MSTWQQQRSTGDATRVLIIQSIIGEQAPALNVDWQPTPPVGAVHAILIGSGQNAAHYSCAAFYLALGRSGRTAASARGRTACLTRIGSFCQILISDFKHVWNSRSVRASPSSQEQVPKNHSPMSQFFATSNKPTLPSTGAAPGCREGFREAIHYSMHCPTTFQHHVSSLSRSLRQRPSLCALVARRASSICSTVITLRTSYTAA